MPGFRPSRCLRAGNGALLPLCWELALFSPKSGCGKPASSRLLEWDHAAGVTLRCQETFVLCQQDERRACLLQPLPTVPLVCF